MKILRLTAENVKKIKVVDISPDGSVVQITGANGSGKSSVLDAIFMALGGTRGIDSKPVRQGTAKAVIRLDLGEVIVTRRFTDAGGTSLVVEATNGARFPSPQKMLDDLLGSLTFDPLAFSRMEPRAQLDVLRGMVRLDIDIDELDRTAARAFAERSDLNRQAKDMQARLAAMPAEDNLPDEAVDISALLAEMEELSDYNSRIDAIEAEKQARLERMNALHIRCGNLRDDAARLLRQADEAEAQWNAEKKALDDAPPTPEKRSAGEVRARIENARALNEKIAIARQYDELAAELEAVEMHADKLSETIEAAKATRENAIATAAMPIAGLSFGDGEVIYRGLPFSQASSAEQLRVSVAIAMAANPKLRVLRIKDGSLLDENGLALITEMADANDYQIWLEKVDTSGKVGVVMVDGEVSGAEEPTHELADVA